jgi:hypothetical protein
MNTKNSLAIMKRPGFGHLNLPLNVGGSGTYYWAEQSSGCLYHALRGSKGLEYNSVSTTTGLSPRGPLILLENWRTCLLLNTGQPFVTLAPDVSMAPN